MHISSRKKSRLISIISIRSRNSVIFKAALRSYILSEGRKVEYRRARITDVSMEPMLNIGDNLMKT